MLIYITGGARSGKSRYGLELAKRLAKKVVFVATCLPEDDELQQRISQHKSERPKHWGTIENPVELSEIFTEISEETEVLLIDCLTLYVSGRLMQDESESKICDRIEKLCQAAELSQIKTIIVSNEVGSGLVPTTPLGRKFRDCAGRANQIVARHANAAYLLVSGLPVQLKGAPLRLPGAPNPLAETGIVSRAKRGETHAG